MHFEECLHGGADDGDVLSALDTNADEEGMSAEELADVTVLRARVKHLDLQRGLMDGELESMSDLARATDAQLRCPLSAGHVLAMSSKPSQKSEP